MGSTGSTAGLAATAADLGPSSGRVGWASRVGAAPARPPPNHRRYSVAGIVVVVLGVFVLIGLIGASADSGGCPDKTAA